MLKHTGSKKPKHHRWVKEGFQMTLKKEHVKLAAHFFALMRFAREI